MTMGLVFKILVILYFLIALRGLGQDVYDGVATWETWLNTFLCTAVIAYALVFLPNKN